MLSSELCPKKVNIWLFEQYMELRKKPHFTNLNLETLCQNLVEVQSHNIAGESTTQNSTYSSGKLFNTLTKALQSSRSQVIFYFLTPFLAIASTRMGAIAAIPTHNLICVMALFFARPLFCLLLLLVALFLLPFIDKISRSV